MSKSINPNLLIFNSNLTTICRIIALLDFLVSNLGKKKKQREVNSAEYKLAVKLQMSYSWWSLLWYHIIQSKLPYHPSISWTWKWKVWQKLFHPKVPKEGKRKKKRTSLNVNLHSVVAAYYFQKVEYPFINYWYLISDSSSTKS